MRVAIIGCGAIGTAIAADLSPNEDIALQLCSRTSFDELTVSWPGGSMRSLAAVLTEPAAARPTDWILLCTKAHQTEAASEWFAALTGAKTNLAILQNGIDHQDRVAPFSKQLRHIVPVIVNLPATRTAPGQVEQRANGRLTVANNEPGREFAKLFGHARTEAVVVEDFATAAWRKLLWNAAVGGACAIHQQGCAILLQPEVRERVRACMLEICMVGRLEGADLPDSLPDTLLASFEESDSDSWPSIAEDRRLGRAMEWRARNEVIVRLAAEHHVSVPANAQLVADLQAADGH